MMVISLVVFSIYIIWGWFLAPTIGITRLIQMLRDTEVTDAQVCPRVEYVLQKYCLNDIKTLIDVVRHITDGNTDAYFTLNRLRQCLNVIATWN